MIFSGAAPTSEGGRQVRPTRTCQVCTCILQDRLSGRQLVHLVDEDDIRLPQDAAALRRFTKLLRKEELASSLVPPALRWVGGTLSRLEIPTCGTVKGRQGKARPSASTPWAEREAGHSLQSGGIRPAVGGPAGSPPPGE